jgi:glucosylceramidase
LPLAGCDGGVSITWLAGLMAKARPGSQLSVVSTVRHGQGGVQFAEGDASFAYTRPGGALTTFTWPASAAIDRGGASADRTTAASHAGRRDAAKAIDDDATTRWTTGTGQQPGQTLQVDAGAVVRADPLVLDTGADVTDYPRGHSISTSLDGTT